MTNGQPFPTSLSVRKLPWPALIRLCYLVTGAVWLMLVRSSDYELLKTALLPILPVLLHLSLVMPRRRPVAVKHPYVFRWIYGTPALACLIPPLLLAVVPTMGGHLGYHASFELRQVFKQSSASAQAAMALGCFWLAYVPIVQFWRAWRCEGWRAIVSRPITVIFVLLCVPVAVGVAVAFASLALNLPGVVPNTVREITKSLLLTLGTSAKFIVVVFFPTAAVVSVLRSCRPSLWQTS